ncbi:transposase [Leptolyngbya sp. FACHB-541]|uniref:transposase n=1 Tax=Leptolyngbya sp. FACHB-541 TaxID=2692810 RepID=UPI001F556264|nr:transposase [Leptolyngbya sp. FACHB-541]
MFGEIVEGEMQLNELGKVTQNYWQRLPLHFTVELNAFTVMPNHLHEIPWWSDKLGRGEAFGRRIVKSDENSCPNASPLQPNGTKPGSIGAIIQNFKSISTQKINRLFYRSHHRQVWQRNYYEHIIRNEKSLHDIRQYIHYNPISWQQDQLHPDNPSRW